MLRRKMQPNRLSDANIALQRRQYPYLLAIGEADEVIAVRTEIGHADDAALRLVRLALGDFAMRFGQRDIVKAHRHGGFPGSGCLTLAALKHDPAAIDQIGTDAAARGD